MLDLRNTLVFAVIGSFESLDILGYMEIKLPMSLQGNGLFTSLLDWNWPTGSQGRI